ncbi:F-box domain-containing protein [Pleurostoma richardsiae]|uniref:F-box domain-containing protein n=1 Tax=Pleurostoma richardsiae TaxID=41990 RepID=A0AA38R1U1_9PEZI|nr:F-box domain-containing protein [Pleurostoma richardsiae]
MSIQKVPIEILWIIAHDLDPEDVFHLSLSCGQFAYLTYRRMICKAALMFGAPFAPETQAARASGNYARALRQLVKRRQAISSAKPYLVALVAVAESYLYVNGMLCYLLDGKVRVIDLHASSRSEIVIDIGPLLSEEIDGYRETKENKFELLHYADGLVSCLHVQHGRAVESSLVILSLREKRVLTTLSLETSHKIFVRNCQDYLYYGTHTDIDADENTRWVLWCYSIRDAKLFDRIHLLDVIGSEIGSSVCFEIIDGYFYGLSTETISEDETEEIDLNWPSFYRAFRFPVGRKLRNTQLSSDQSIWRRNQVEGPIDDRWTFIRLQKDERSGRLQVIELRSEWLAGRRSGRRTYYTTDLDFPEANDEHVPAAGQSEQAVGHDAQGDNLPGEAETPSDASRATPKRCPYHTHPGDETSSPSHYAFTRNFVQSYHSASQAFLDLVVDRLPSETEARRLRLLAGSRRLRPADEICEAELGASLSTEEEISKLFRANGENTISFWPPDSDPVRADPVLDASLDDLYRVLNPPTFDGNVTGTWDDRSLLYATEGEDTKALVFVSFDPAIYLSGLPAWSGPRPAVRPIELAEGIVYSARTDSRDPGWWSWEVPMYKAISDGISYGYTLDY